jgi:subtilisin-like proprotein convertase family protein/subtilisin family serine protease
MPEPEATYTYRAGEKIPLEKAPDQFVVRALPEHLEAMGIDDAERVSPHSSRVTTRVSDLEPEMTRMRNLAPTHHAYTETATGTEFLITDRILVTFREPPPPEQIDAFAARYSLALMTAYSDRDYLFQLTDHTGINPVKLVVKLTEEEPLVAVAEHDLNQRMKTYAVSIPTDPSYQKQWHLHTRLNDPQFDQRSSSRCEDAWQLLNHLGSADVVVGVTDDGCKLSHQDFDSPGKFAGWGYFRGERLIANTDIDAQPDQMYKTGANHGTSCAGVIAGEVDAVLTVGAAPGCRLLPIQWESDGASLFISDSKLLTALNFVADKVDVLSNSWGSTPSSFWSLQVTNRITSLATTGGRRGRGIVFLWAAGNENCPINHVATVNVPHTDGWQQRPDGSWIWIGVQTSRQFRNNLVGIAGLMHVAALASSARRSHYSNYGPGIMICAPTSNVHVYHRLSVPGLGVTTTTGEPGGMTDVFGGTSSATPLMAGIAALTISANPDLTAHEVVSILKQTASKDLSMDAYQRTPPANFDPNPVWDVSPVSPFDAGVFNNIGAAEGTWSPWFGHGRGDAARAVEEALKRRGGTADQTLRQASTPALNIPDNNPGGALDKINLPAAMALSSIKVVVDITHTFIGDLRLTLTAPSGTAVVLHQRNGGNAQNIQRTFDLTSTPGLGALRGQFTQGDWTLLVQDLAAVDTGRLNRWELEIQGQEDAVASLSENPGVSIPDNNVGGIERSVATTESGTVHDVEVAVDITHSFIGDLEVTLVSPAGTSVPLHQRAGGGADNIIKTYTPATTPLLQTLRAQPIQGTWRLKVADLEAADVGKLNGWAVKITRAP